MNKLILFALSVLCVVLLISGCAVPINSEQTDSTTTETTTGAKTGVETTIKVEDEKVSADKTIVAETDTKIIDDTEDVTATVEATADGTKTEVQLNKEVITADIAPTAADEAAFKDWCVKGKIWTYHSNQGSVEVIYDGIVDYKGGKYCKGFHTQIIQGMSINTVYYTTYGAEDIWIETNVAGQKSEVHVTQK